MALAKKTFLCIVFFISSSHASELTSLTIENILQKKENSEWVYSFISESFDSISNKISEDNIAKLFEDKKIVFNGDSLSITNTCKYRYSALLHTPVSFWGSYETVKQYEEFFSGYKIKMPTKILDITPMNPSEECEYPFSEFIVLDDKIVFFYKNNAVFYFKDQGGLRAHKNKNTKENATTGRSPVDISRVCKEIERNKENYDTIHECFYKGMDITNTYLQYRSESGNGKYLQDKLTLNKNFSIKCDSGCIDIIYKWNGPDNLIIRQQFEGGETEISFSNESKGCRVLTKSFPD